MSQTFIRFTFAKSVPAAELEGTLHLARLATESLHGEDRVRLEAGFSMDHAAHAVVIDATGEVGRTLALIFRGYARREFGADAFEMHRTRDGQPQEAAGARG